MADRLRAYRAKRDLEGTPEPGGLEGRGPSTSRFVVQEHHARRLHWDLRLEHDGVLASWAVPRGIPERPEDDRLAVHTEDHPLEYLEFSGDIPKGNYGAGTMGIWDTGTYEQHKWREDEVMVTFHGERVRGRYVLFRTKGKDWMLHRMDPAADPGAEPLPEKVAPMLARAGELPRDGGAWAYEVKWDGVRALVWVDSGQVRLESRNGRDITAQYPELGGLGRALGSRPALLDGEVIAPDAQGRPSFERLQGRMHVGSEAAVQRRRRDTPVALMVFDVLHLDGRSLMDRPWTERRAALEGLGLDGPHWKTPAVLAGDPEAVTRVTREGGFEGLVAKKRSSCYEPGRRTGCWVKVKHVRRQEFVVGGWLPGEGRRRERIGALLIGYHDEGALRYAGRVGTGFTQAELTRVGRELAARERGSSPFTGGRLPKGAQWVEPELVAEVAFTEWTRAGQIRHPSYKGMRDDADPASVVREGEEPVDESPPPPPAPPPAAPAKRRTAKPSSHELEIDGRRLKISNLEKPLWSTGFTKGQMLDFYIRIAPVLLPHLRDRPLTRKRYPDGVEAGHFFEKNAPGHRPDWVRTARVGDTEFVVCDDLPTLVWVANLASLELHTSLSEVEDMAHPTLLVFDLDPGAPADIVDCCGVGLEVRALLAELGVECFAKTSGSKGLQVYAPLDGAASYARTKPFAKGVAGLLEARAPDRIVSRMTKSLRPGKVFVDWSQNDEHKTTVAVYSLRAREAPTVSTPVTWEEVEACHAAHDPDLLRFEGDTVLRRVEEHGDLFAPLESLVQAMPQLPAAEVGARP